VPPLPEIKISRTRLGVYRYLVDGKGPGTGITIEEIAGKLKISNEAVRKHVKFLESNSYILKIPGTIRPVFYKRGPKSNLLDKALIGFESNPQSNFDSGTVNSNQISEVESNPLNTPNNSVEIFDIPTARTHINGRVIFEVLKIGDMHNIAVPDGEGKRTYPLFPKAPNRDQHNTRSWRCKVPFDGYEVSIELWETENHRQMFVWPPQLELVPEQFGNAEAMMITRAQQAVNLLAKYGGWQFGIINFKGEIEFASTDDRLLCNIPEDMRSLPGSDLYVDGSAGKGKKGPGPELETKNHKTAKVVFDFPTTVRNLENGQEVQTSRVYALEMTTEKLLRVVEMLLEMKTMELEKETSQLIQEETKKARVGKPGDELANAKPSDNGMMYQ
jgi:DNA-binding Lrp family transcriptional regulator